MEIYHSSSIRRSTKNQEDRVSNDGHTVYDQHWSSGGSEVLENWVSGEENPHWKSQVASGQNATTFLQGIKHEIVEDEPYELFLDVYKNTFPYGWTLYAKGSPAIASYFSADSALLGATPSRTRNLALSYWHTNANSAFGSLQAAVIAGEAKETVGMLRTRGTSIYDGVTDFLGQAKKLGRQYRNARNAVRNLADLWLEYSLGWSPFIKDIEDTIEYVNTDFTDVHSSKITGYHESNELVYEYASPIVNNVLADWYGHLRKTRNYSIRYYGVVNCKDQKQVAKYETLNIAPHNWLPSLHELIPYSFLVGYFVNLDAIIAGISNWSLDVSWAACTETAEETIKAHNLGLHTKFPGYTKTEIHTNKPGRLEIKKRGVYRYPLDEVPIPGLVFSLPGSARQVANITALALAHSEARSRYSHL